MECDFIIRDGLTEIDLPKIPPALLIELKEFTRLNGAAPIKSTDGENENGDGKSSSCYYNGLFWKKSAEIVVRWLNERNLRGMYRS